MSQIFLDQEGQLVVHPQRHCRRGRCLQLGQTVDREQRQVRLLPRKRCQQGRLRVDPADEERTHLVEVALEAQKANRAQLVAIHRDDGLAGPVAHHVQHCAAIFQEARHDVHLDRGVVAHSIQKDQQVEGPQIFAQHEIRFVQRHVKGIRAGRPRLQCLPDEERLQGLAPFPAVRHHRHLRRRAATDPAMVGIVQRVRLLNLQRSHRDVRTRILEVHHKLCARLGPQAYLLLGRLGTRLQAQHRLLWRQRVVAH